MRVFRTPHPLAVCLEDDTVAVFYTVRGLIKIAGGTENFTLGYYKNGIARRTPLTDLEAIKWLLREYKHDTLHELYLFGPNIILKIKRVKIHDSANCRSK